MERIGFKEVEPNFCPVCGQSFTRVTRPKSEIIEGRLVPITRFKCPRCKVSIEDTKSNRCPTCQVMCADTMALQVHLYGGCEHGLHA